MKLTKDDLIKAVYLKIIGNHTAGVRVTRHDLARKSDVVKIVEDLFETIKQTLERGEQVRIYGFGNFSPRDKKSRPGRNINTGEQIEITARRVVTFKASPVLKNKINVSKPGEIAKG